MIPKKKRLEIQRESTDIKVEISGLSLLFLRYVLPSEGNMGHI